MAAPTPWEIGSRLSAIDPTNQAGTSMVLTLASVSSLLGAAGVTCPTGSGVAAPVTAVSAAPETVAVDPVFLRQTSPTPISANVSADGNQDSGSGMNSAYASATGSVSGSIGFPGFGGSISYVESQIGTASNVLTDATNPDVSSAIDVATKMLNSQMVSVTPDQVIQGTSFAVTTSQVSGSRSYTLVNNASNGVSVYLEENVSINFNPPAPVPYSPVDVGVLGGGVTLRSPELTVSMSVNAGSVVTVQPGSTIISESNQQNDLLLSVQTPVTLPPYPGGPPLWTISYSAGFTTEILDASSGTNGESLYFKYSASFSEVSLPAAALKG